MGHEHHRGTHGHEHAHGHGEHGSAEEIRGYVERLESPERMAWQRPDEVVAALGLHPGAVVADIGAGVGYFTLRLARAVGESGHVFAVDVEPRLIEVLRERIAASGVRNVAPIWALPDDPLLPPASCDVVLMVTAYHHFPDGPAMLARLARALRPGGRLVNIDFKDGDFPIQLPPPEMRVSRETFLDAATRAGLSLEREPELLPYQDFFVLARSSIG